MPFISRRATLGALAGAPSASPLTTSAAHWKKTGSAALTPNPPHGGLYEQVIARAKKK